MIVLTDRAMGDEDHKIIINEALIETIKPHERSGGCSIYMASGAIVVVGESARSVLKAIWGLGDDATAPEEGALGRTPYLVGERGPEIIVTGVSEPENPS